MMGDQVRADIDLSARKGAIEMLQTFKQKVMCCKILTSTVV